MSLMRIFVCGCVVAAFFAAQPVEAACDSTASAITSSAITTALAAVSAGQTACIPAGSGTLTAAVTVPAGVTLQGAGEGTTTVTRDTAINTTGLFVLSISAGLVTRISNFTCDTQNDAVPADAACVEVNVAAAAGLNLFRVDNIDILNIDQRGVVVNAVGVIASGLIDHVTFHCGSLNCQGIAGNQNCAGGNDNAEYNVLDNALNFGSGYAVYVEDSYFAYTDNNDASIDGYCAGRIVQRFNTMSGANFGSHGTDSGNRRGTQQWEIYGNAGDLDLYACAPSCTTADWSGRWHHIRTGTGFFFDNTWINAIDGANQIYYYRGDPAFVPDVSWHYGACTSAQGGPWVRDGDIGGAHPVGYPCAEQPGTYFTRFGADGGSYSIVPVYSFNNTRTGVGEVPITVSSLNLAVTDANGTNDYFTANVDYYNLDTTNCPAAGSTCTAGIGRGTRAQLDAHTTCTAGVAFWVTNEGSWNTSTSNPRGVQRNGEDGQLYKCTATDTWTLYYTPYTYPHPLQGASSEQQGVGRTVPRRINRSPGDDD